MKGKRIGGRQKGTANRSTQEIKQIIHGAVDFAALVKGLAERAMKGSDRAALILFEYGFGKPTQTINATVERIDRSRAAEVFRDIFAGGQELAVSASGQLVSGPESIQDSPQGPPGNGHDDSHRPGSDDLSKDAGR